MGLLGKIIKVALALTLAALAVRFVLPKAFASAPSVHRTTTAPLVRLAPVDSVSPGT